MKSVGNGDIAEYYAIMLMTIIIYINAISIDALIYSVLDVNLNILSDSKLIIGISLLFILFLFYLLFVQKGKYLKIDEEFGHETKRKSLLGNLAVLSYMFFSIAILMLCFYLMIQRNKGLM